MGSTLSIRVASELTTRVPGMFVETRIVRDIKVLPSAAVHDDLIAQTIMRWKDVREEELASEPLVLTYRKLARQLGGDPAKMTPAVEGLLKRAVADRFPRINSIVDAANITSLRYLTPIGVFDLNKITGDILLTLSTSGDQFVPIGKDEPMNLLPGTPVLKDAVGIFSAIGSRDSKRTMIGYDTRNVLAVSWGCEDVHRSLITMVLNEYANRILKS